jgi:hypothetical protein
MRLAAKPSMSAHLKGVVVLGLVTVLAIVVGAFWSPYVAFGLVFLSITVWFVVSIGWMRPSGLEEHDVPHRWFRRKAPR